MTFTSPSSLPETETELPKVKVKNAVVMLNDYAKTLQDHIEHYNTYNPAGTWIVRHELKDYRDIVFALIDDIFQRSFRWAPKPTYFETVLEKYFPDIPSNFYCEVIDMLEIQIRNDLLAANILDGSTWDLITLSRFGQDLMVQNAGDFRIWDWTRMKAQENQKQNIPTPPQTKRKMRLVSISNIKKDPPKQDAWNEIVRQRVAEQKNKHEG